MKLNSPLPLWEDLPADFWRDSRKLIMSNTLDMEDYWFGAVLPTYNPDNLPAEITNRWVKFNAFRILKSYDELYAAVLIVPIQSRPFKVKSAKSGNEWWECQQWHPYLLGYFCELKDAYIACQIHSQKPDIYSMFDMSINDIRCDYLPNQPT